MNILTALTLTLAVYPAGIRFHGRRFLLTLTGASKPTQPPGQLLPVICFLLLKFPSRTPNVKVWSLPPLFARRHGVTQNYADGQLSVEQLPKSGPGCLTVEVSRSHTHTHTR